MVFDGILRFGDIYMFENSLNIVKKVAVAAARSIIGGYWEGGCFVWCFAVGTSVGPWTPV